MLWGCWVLLLPLSRFRSFHVSTIPHLGCCRSPFLISTPPPSISKSTSDVVLPPSWNLVDLLSSTCSFAPMLCRLFCVLPVPGGLESFLLMSALSKYVCHPGWDAVTSLSGKTGGFSFTCSRSRQFLIIFTIFPPQRNKKKLFKLTNSLPGTIALSVFVSCPACGTSLVVHVWDVQQASTPVCFYVKTV